MKITFKAKFVFRGVLSTFTVSATVTQQQLLTHFFDNVIPAFEYYVELSKMKDNKKAMLMNAALDVAGKLFHFRDKLEPHFPPKTFRRPDVARLCPDFDWLGDVFNASKHTELDRKDRIIKDSTHIEEITVWTCFPYKDEVHRPRKFYSTVQQRIMVTPLRDKGSIRDLLEICTSVLNFWGDFLVTRGLIKYYPNSRYEGNDVASEDQPDLSSDLFYPGYDGKTRVAMIARLYDPVEGKFKRCGFTPDGQMTLVEVSEWAPNGKIYFHQVPVIADNNLR